MPVARSSVVSTSDVVGMRHHMFYNSLVQAISSSYRRTTRTWNDSFDPVGDAGRANYVPDCDLRNLTDS